MRTSAPNLFAAAKAYAVAMNRLLPDFQESGLSAAIAMPFYLLAGFAFELSLKAVVLHVERNEPALKKIGHDLPSAFNAARAVGYQVDDGGTLEQMISKLGPPHAAFVARYVPDVELIMFPGPRLLQTVLADHLHRVESQFEIWGTS
jgi:hypothetical protein